MIPANKVFESSGLEFLVLPKPRIVDLLEQVLGEVCFEHGVVPCASISLLAISSWKGFHETFTPEVAGVAFKKDIATRNSGFENGFTLGRRTQGGEQILSELNRGKRVDGSTCLLQGLELQLQDRGSIRILVVYFSTFQAQQFLMLADDVPNLMQG